MSVPAIGVFLLASALAATGQPCRLPPLGGTPSFPGAEGGRFCAPQKLPVREATWQVLVDDSGSMRGVSACISPLVRWIGQALSHLRRSDLEWKRGRTCLFSSRQAFDHCSDGLPVAVSASGQGETTLDAAIREARRADLTFLFTDGAAASGSGQGDCAAGVDAACVGRALSEVLRPAAGERVGAAGGLWLVPLVTMHRGPFFTEQPMPPASLNAPAVADSLTRELGVQVALRNPRLARDGTLIYDYEGPRVLLLFILARQAELGRAAVAALQARMEFSGIAALERLSAPPGGMGALPAVEIFPGAVRGVRWARLRVLEPTCSSVSARLRPDGRVEAGCVSPNASAIVVLYSAAEPESADCARIYMLPALQASVRFLQIAGKWRAFAAAAWAGSAWDANQPLQLRLQFGCSPGMASALEGACQTGAEIWLQRDLAQTAAGLLRGSEHRPAVQLLRAISASSVVRAPHKAFQLTETLERFYAAARIFEKDEPRRLGTVEVCGAAAR